MCSVHGEVLWGEESADGKGCGRCEHEGWVVEKEMEKEPEDVSEKENLFFFVLLNCSTVCCSMGNMVLELHWSMCFYGIMFFFFLFFSF